MGQDGVQGPGLAHHVGRQGVAHLRPVLVPKDAGDQGGMLPWEMLFYRRGHGRDTGRIVGAIEEGDLAARRFNDLQPAWPADTSQPCGQIPIGDRLEGAECLCPWTRLRQVSLRCDGPDSSHSERGVEPLMIAKQRQHHRVEGRLQGLGGRNFSQRRSVGGGHLPNHFERRGIISPYEGSKPRTVLLREPDLERLA